ncbi:MAG TPA: hypothetical protein VL727_18290 [Puia sp.]|nr:hypothetical protein [Puia sp.]
MKNVLLTSLLVAGCVLGVVNSSFSQNGISMIRKASIVSAMRDLGYSSPLNTKAERDFRKRFAATEGERWFEYRNGYAAIFASGDVRYRVEYDSKGNWNGTEKGYKGTMLDRDIRRLVKQTYIDYDIAYVKEFMVPGMFGTPVYVITIEDEGSFKTLSVCEDEVRVKEEYLKNL